MHLIANDMVEELFPAESPKEDKSVLDWLLDHSRVKSAHGTKAKKDESNGLR